MKFALTAKENLIVLCDDKEKINNLLHQYTGVFIKTYNNKNIEKAIKNKELSYPCIVKPRNGGGSLGLWLLQNSNEIERITDAEIIQEYLYPHKGDKYHEFFCEEVTYGNIPQMSEVSIQIVSDVNGNIIGKMATINKVLLKTESTFSKELIK